MNRALLRKELERDEGVRPIAYRDSVGYWTIGIGHLLGTSPRMSSITDEEITALYEFDVAAAERLAREVVPMFDGMNDARQRATVNMAFNRGGHMRTSSTIVPAIRKAAASNDPQDWINVELTILPSPWAKQVGDRAKRLGRMLATGEAPVGAGG